MVPAKKGYLNRFFCEKASIICNSFVAVSNACALFPKGHS